MIKNILEQLKVSKVFNNMSWIISGKCIQMIISFIVGLITARYLGPSNYGLISTATAYTAFFQPICNIGMSAMFVKIVMDDKKNEGNYIGTGILLRCVASIISIVVIMIIVKSINPDNRSLQVVCFIHSFVLLFHAFDLFEYWYQTRYESKFSSIISVVGYIISSVYKIVLLVLGKSVEWFAFATVLDYLAIAVIYIVYTVPKNNLKLSFSKNSATILLRSGKHFILSDLLVVSYAYLDRIMLSKMMDSTAVGLYTTATAVTSMWVFVLAAYINSVRPAIVEVFHSDKTTYEKKIVQLYSVIIWLSILISSIICILAPLIIMLLYGKEYMGAVNPLRIITWYTGFSYLGVARSIWTVCENKQRFEKYFALCGVIVNFIINIVLIQLWGIEGAALASLITQIMTNVIVPYLIKGTRNNAIMVIKAFNPKNILIKN